MHFSSLFSILLPLLSFIPSIHAWDCSLQFQEELQNEGLTQLAALFPTFNQTTVGQDLLSKISQGNNFTFFAPTNEAIGNVSSQVSANSTLFAEYLAYHFVRGNFQNVSSSYGQPSPTSSSAASSSTESSSTTESSTSQTSTATSAAAASLLGRIFRRRNNRGADSSSPQLESGIFPNTTVGRTLLNASELVHLPGNNSQVLAWTRIDENSNVTILNQVSNSNSSQNITVINSKQWGSIFINQINGVLIPPGNVTTALNATNATVTSALLGSVQIPSANGTNVTATEFLQEADGITFFVPNNEAFTTVANETIAALQNNVSALVAVLENHYINGTVLYSPEIQLLGQNSSSSSNSSSPSPRNSTTSTNATSAAGEPLQFVSNSSGTFVESNGLSAKIVRPDVLIDNGVIHIVDTVLLNNASDPAAASSAFAEATSSAATITTETGPIGVATPTSSSESSSSTSESSSSASTSESSATTTSTSETSTSATTTTTSG